MRRRERRGVWQARGAGARGRGVGARRRESATRRRDRNREGRRRREGSRRPRRGSSSRDVGRGVAGIRCRATRRRRGHSALVRGSRGRREIRGMQIRADDSRRGFVREFLRSPREVGARGGERRREGCVEGDPARVRVEDCAPRGVESVAQRALLCRRVDVVREKDAGELSGAGGPKRTRRRARGGGCERSDCSLMIAHWSRHKKASPTGKAV
jgi:hypothetical protein